MTFTLRYVADYKARRSTKYKIFSSILEESGNTDGRVAVASTSADIHFVGAPALDPSLSRDA